MLQLLKRVILAFLAQNSDFAKIKQETPKDLHQIMYSAQSYPGSMGSVIEHGYELA